MNCTVTSSSWIISIRVESDFNYLTYLKLFKSAITYKRPLFDQYFLLCGLWNKLWIVDFLFCFDSLVLLLPWDLLDLSLRWENILVVSIGQSLLVVLPHNTVEERMILYLLSAIETKSSHRIPNHKFGDKVSCLCWHHPWELNRSRLNVLVQLF